MNSSSHSLSGLFSRLTATFLVGLLLIISLLPVAQAATTTADQATNAGALTLTSPGNLTLGAITVVGTNSTITGTVTGIGPSDLRGSSAGWSVSMTSSHLGLVGAGIKKRKVTGAGAINLADITVANAYDGLNQKAGYSATGAISSGEFQVNVDSVAGTPAKPATVTVTKPDGSTATPAVASNAITLNGITITFSGTAVYAVNDKFGFSVDHYAYTQLTVTPGTLAGTGTPAADTTGMALGAGAALTGSGATSASRTDLTADATEGMGGYTFNDSLSWVLHSNSLQGSYQATLTYTIL